MRVAVVGAGVVGASVARELARRGADVTLIDRHHPGYGTSGTSFAWTNSHNKQPASYHLLNVAGCAEHARLAADTGQARRWYFPTGNLQWDAASAGGERLEERVGQLEHLGYPCRWMEPGEARRLEPDIVLASDVERVAYFPSEGHVLPVVLLATLLGEARDHGAAMRWLAPVTAVEPHGSGADLVFSDGERARFDCVVSCVGRWSEQLAATSGAHLPLVDASQPGGAAVGFLAYTRPVPIRLSRVLTTPSLNVRPDGGGRLLLQGLDLDAGADPADPPKPGSQVATNFTDRLARVLTRDMPVEVESVRVGQRVLPTDGLTVAGFLPGSERCYVVATHSGITLGPLLGQLVAAELIDEETSPLLADFRPDRFGGSDAVTATAARQPGEQ